MAFAIAYPTYTAGPYERGRQVTLYDPEYRRVEAIEDGVTVFDGRGKVIQSRKSGSKPIRLSSDIFVLRLNEGQPLPEIDHLPELD
ncbi:MAG: hypothetical protein AAB800_00725 [Patescibacteria group bacterium]